MHLAGASEFYGSSADGAFNSAGNVTWAVGSDDGGPVVKQFSSFVLNNGHTLTVDRRCKGVIIFVAGDCTINGTIDMSSFAARVSTSSTQPHLFPINVTNGLLHPGKSWSASYASLIMGAVMGGAGGAGGRGGGQSYVGGLGGLGGPPSWYGGGVGGGGGGGASVDGGGAANGADGGSVTDAGQVLGSPGAAVPAGTLSSNPGGAGAGASGAGSSSASGGAGGNAPGGGGGGGGYYYGGAYNGGAGNAGSAYGGGLVVFVVKGNLTIGATGLIKCNGGNGGGAGNGGGGGGGGGAGGGGVVLLLYKGTYSNTGAIQVNGGTGGSGGSAGANQAYGGGGGYAGEVGVIQTKQIA